MKAVLLILISCLLGGNLKAQRVWGEWTTWGEQPDGTFLNPVIPADYSDIDCIKVGEHYYAISSTMQLSPGMTVLHSTDLVNWEIVSHAVHDLTQIGEELSWERMNRYGRGVWAGSLRYHDGRFYIFFGAPDEGFFMTSARDAEGPWDPLVCLLREPGWDDCTAIWDDDGKAYFLGTKFKDGYKSYIFDMAADGTRIDLHSARLVNSGNRREASKLIRHGEYYYLVFSEHKGNLGRYVMAKRDKKITGDFAEERQLLLPCRAEKEPNQGGIVEGPDGNWYFFTHHGTADWGGRMASLLPVRWIDDWPIIGEQMQGEPGKMVWQMSMPKSGDGKCTPTIRRSDDFDEAILGVQWQWNHQPRREMFSLTERPGWMRLKAFRPLKPDCLLKAGNTLTQRAYRTRVNEVTVKMDITGMQDGGKAGLCHYARNSGSLGVSLQGDSCHVEWRENDQLMRKIPVKTSCIWLRSVWSVDGLSTFYYSINGDDFVLCGSYRLSWGFYRGDRVGIYCFNNLTDGGWIDVDYLHYRME
ncbi:MAG: glycoside hydrolase 43 family protein [Bacteroidaceae bacterium]|nr:glycoside hydrolase 43 family protein [Bacteroidaceae bacterium]